MHAAPVQDFTRAPAAPAAGRPAAAAGHVRARGGERLHGGRRHRQRHPRPAEPLPVPAAGLRRRGDRADAVADALRLLAPARLEVRRLRLHDRLDRARLRAGLLGARLAARDRVRLLQLPGVGARQAAPDRGAGCVHGRPHAAPGRARDDQQDRAAGPGAGDARDRAAGPGLGARLPGHRARRAVRGGHRMDPLRGAGGARSGRDRGRAARRARRRVRGAEAVPAGPPHGVPKPLGRSCRRGLPDQSIADGDRRRRQDRPRRGHARQSSTSCPSTTRTSSSPSWARSSASSGRRSSCRCSRS